ncbi:hypothetical protein [Phocaeicola plebeius]|uniref:hypothetical protein n=1 Tax=Phocaeicola plebeius TaxID=310297 RepID=UPI003AF0DAA6
MLETEYEIRTFILNKLEEIKICRIAAINCKCKNENMCFKVIDQLVLEELIDKDDNFIWLKK